MSVHGAKGLEFDVVLCPFIQRTRADDTGPVIWHDQAVGRSAPRRRRRIGLDRRVPCRAHPRRSRRARVERGGKRVPAPPLRGAHEGAAPHRRVVAARLLERRRAPRRADRAAARPRRPTRPGAAAPSATREGAAVLRARRRRRARRAADAPRRDRRPWVARARRGDDARPTGPPAGDAATAGASRRPPSCRSPRSTVARRARAPVLVLLARGGRARRSRHPRRDGRGLGRGRRGRRAARGTPGTSSSPTTSRSATARAPLDDDPFGGLHGTAFGTAVHEALEAALRRDADVAFDDAAAAALDDVAPPSRDRAEPRGDRRAARRVRCPDRRGVARCASCAATTPRASSASRCPSPRASTSPAVARALSSADGTGPFDGWARAARRGRHAPAPSRAPSSAPSTS